MVNSTLAYKPLQRIQSLDLKVVPYRHVQKTFYAESFQKTVLRPESAYAISYLRCGKIVQ
jgi:hypothetical protein